MTHTVDEVSDLLDVPRPTLYRYLREYSIPHLRRSGKIYVPEESFDRIKEIRELHKEGLGTESVRRRLRGESNLDVVEGIEERLDRISEALEDLRGNLKPANGVATQALQTILERQSLLISELSNLTGRLEELTYANGRYREVAFSDPEEETRKQEIPFEEPPGTIENDPAANEPIVETSPGPATSLTAPTLRKRRFGAMARRRRRGALAVLLLALLTGIILAAYALNERESPGASQEETSPPQEAAPSGSEEVSTGGSDSSDTTPSAPAANNHEREPAGYAEDGRGSFAREQPLYQTQYQPQYATPEPFPRGEYAPPQFDDPGNQPAVYPPIPAQSGPAPG